MLTGSQVGFAAMLTTLSLGLAAAPARAADTMVAPGMELTLTDDVVLSGGDNFTAGATGGARCKIHGTANGFGFLADKDAGWTGTLIIRNCDLDHIGTDTLEGFLLFAAGNGKVIIENSTLSQGGIFEATVSEHVDVVFNNNVIAKDSAFPEVTLLLDSPAAFHVTGETDGMKLFQGNLVEKGRIKLTSTSGWIIGGSMPAEGNVLIGTRAGIELENASLTEVRGNYSHTLVEGPRWNQVKNLSVASGDGNTIEHNVFWGRNWLIEMDGGGELRYNLFLDAVERGWILTWTDAGAKIHHNISVATKTSQEGPTGGIVLENARESGANPTVETYNNTFDLGGKCNPAVGGAVVLKGSSVMLSLRSNVFTGLRVIMEPQAAFVRAAESDEAPEHLGYADYNLFFAPDSPVKLIYGATVANKTVRVDPGFAQHDLPMGGAVDSQVDPQFAGPVPKVFPFDEEMIKKRATTVCQILAYYRKVYTPGPGSPLIDAGDPGDKEGNDVGAVGAGVDNPDDLFGRLCDETDIGTPKATADVFQCGTVDIVPPEGGTGAGGSGPIVAPEGITCVCGVGATTPRPGVAAVGLVVVLGVLARRRRRGQ